MSALQWFLMFAVIGAVLFLSLRVMMSKGSRRPRRGPGPGAAGAIYDMLNEDKRKAIEIIVEQRTGYKDPEHADDKPKTGIDGTKEG